RRPGLVRDVRFFPLTGNVVGFRRRHVGDVVDPAVPARRNPRRLGIAVIDHPAPLEMQRRVDLPALGAIIAVALLVLADELAEPPGPQLRAEGLAVPPREELEQELFHAGLPADVS